MILTFFHSAEKFLFPKLKRYFNKFTTLDTISQGKKSSSLAHS